MRVFAVSFAQRSEKTDEERSISEEVFARYQIYVPIASGK